jgi:hypothetical protein
MYLMRVMIEGWGGEQEEWEKEWGRGSGGRGCEQGEGASGERECAIIGQSTYSF